MIGRRKEKRSYSLKTRLTRLCVAALSFMFSQLRRIRASTLLMCWRNMRRDYISIAEKHATNEIFDEMNGLIFFLQPTSQCLHGVQKHESRHQLQKLAPEGNFRGHYYCWILLKSQGTYPLTRNRVIIIWSVGVWSGDVPTDSWKSAANEKQKEGLIWTIENAIYTYYQ